MFGTILISIMTLMQLYVFLRAASVPLVRRHVSRQTLLIAAVVAWAILFSGRTLGHDGTGPAAAILEFSGMTLMGVIFLSFITMLAADLTTLGGLILKQWAPRMRGWALAAGVILSIIALVQGMRPPVVTRHEVRLTGLPAALDGTVLAVVSDTHLGSLIGERWLAGRIEQINELNPDMIILLGDIFEGHGGSEEAFARLFRQLAPPLGVWAVTGNHEFHGRNNQGIRRMEQAGFRLLRDQWAQTAPGLIVAGVDDLTTRRRDTPPGDPVAAALSGRPAGAAILLSHSPLEYEKAAALGAGLMLSGHTHDGQIWPFNHLERLVYPLLSGRFQVDNMTLIVCRGTGTWGPRMRLWLPGEILAITLRSGG
ncbi:MAG: metallophosphoesterase [Thermodesulfobacteriota bacterium]